MSKSRETTFFCPGHIQPWQRTTGGRHTPKETREFQAKVRLFAKAAGVRRLPANVAVHLFLEIVYPRPKRPTYPFPTRGDASNTLKSIEDALNKVAYDDDRQVTYFRVLKRFAVGNEEPGVWVTVKGIWRQGPRERKTG